MTTTKKAVEDNIKFLDEQEGENAGFEQINSATMAIPFAKVLQKLSPELDKSNSAFNEDAEEGDIINTVTKEIYGKSLNLIVLKFDHVYVEWTPKEKGGGLVDYHSPENAMRLKTPDSKFGKWTTESGNNLVENYMYYCLIKGREKEGLIISTLTSTNISSAKKWNTQLTTTVMPSGKRAMPWWLVWEFASVAIKNNKGSWFGINVKQLPGHDGYISQQQFSIAQEEQKALPTANVDYSQLENKSGPVSSEDNSDKDAAY